MTSPIDVLISVRMRSKKMYKERDLKEIREAIKYEEDEKTKALLEEEELGLEIQEEK